MATIVRPGALRPQVRATARRSGAAADRRRSSTGEPGPGGVQVGVVGVRHQRHELRARAAGPRPRRWRRCRPAGGTTPCATARRAGRAPCSARPAVDDDVALVVDAPRQQHAPLDPRMLEHVERARQVAADRVPHHLAADHDAVEGVLLAGHELLEEHRLRGARRRRRQPLAEAGVAVDAERVAGAGAGERLGDEREADLGGEGDRLVGRRRPAGCGHTARRRRRTPPSSAPCRGSCRRRPGRCRGCRGARAPRRAAPGGSRGCRAGGRRHRRGRRPRRRRAVSASTSRQSASCQCPAIGASPNDARRVAADHDDLGRRARAATAPTKRTVAAIAYGATNTTFAIAADRTAPRRHAFASAR